METAGDRQAGQKQASETLAGDHLDGDGQKGADLARAPRRMADLGGESLSGSKTLVEGAYETLRREILDGVFAPGTKLRMEELRSRYNVSGSTVREALTRLLGEALVTSEGQRGFRVAPASLEDFEDLTRVRVLVETEALRQAIAHGDEAWESQIVASFYRLSKVEERLMEDRKGAINDYEARNRDFHSALIAACPSRWLHHIIGLLFQQSERYRRMALSSPPVPRDLHAEHQAIFDATLARDADRASRLLAEHIERTLTALRSSLEEFDKTPVASGGKTVRASVQAQMAPRNDAPGKAAGRKRGVIREPRCAVPVADKQK
ncbi:GntR family transcriptional regulator [Xanthobacter sp. TB0139]|uniref:GntR family transcriptional regulator n=1 Tax=Xanthobacter sp. TB0139 TaxID=3459178 RepID=UPI0040392A89